MKEAEDGISGLEAKVENFNQISSGHRSTKTQETIIQYIYYSMRQTKHLI